MVKKMFSRSIVWYVCFLFFIVFCCAYAGFSYASQLTIELTFPRKNTAPLSAPVPIPVPLEVSGNLFLDIAPYPEAAEKDRYTVEYFLDDVKIYETTGLSRDTPDTLNFTYILTTRAYENGSHTLVVNFWDSKGQSAIGIREIIIKNED